MNHGQTLLRVLLLAPLAMLHAADAPATKPNIVFILADDLGWRDVACYGGTSFETPNMDRLAAQGVRLTDAYAASPICSPTRASILTGLYPARLGITGASGHVPEVQLEKKLAAGTPKVRAFNAESVTRLKTEYFTLPEALRKAGYATAHFGKWHVGHNLAPGDRFEPKDQGFDIDFPHTPTASGPGSGYLAPWEFIKDPDIRGRPGEHIDDRMADEAATFIGEHKDKPFFVSFWAYSVHSPYNARRDYLEHFQVKADGNNPPPNPLYAAMVKSLDDSVGRLMGAVEKEGLTDRTIIVFFSDNGGWVAPPKGKTQPRGFENLPVTSNRPLASGKASIYEGGTRVPCIVVWPGKIKPGTVDTALFQSTDWFPTLLAMCGVPSPADVKLDGVNQMPALLGQGPVRDRVFCHFPHGAPGSHASIPGYLPAASVRLDDWKLIRFFADNDDGSDRFELYNLKDDLGESKNLASVKPERVRELNELITGFLRDTEAVLPVRNPGYDPNAPHKQRQHKAKPLPSASGSEPLETQFASPADQARPWVWYRWQGPVSRAGLDADVDAISGAGFGGLVLDFSDGQPLKEVKLGHGPEFGGKEFFDLVFYTLERARERGLQVAVMPQNGWASAGGSWIAPQHQEHALVWAEEVVQGPGKVELKLRPPLREGTFYEDVALLAFPVDNIPVPTRFRRNPPAVTADLEAAEAPTGYWKADPQAVVDGKPGTLLSLRPPRGARPSAVVLTFAESFAAERLYLHPGPSYINNLSSGRFVLEVSEDGRKFRRVHEFAYDPDRDNGTGGFMVNLPAQTTARVWRLQLADMKHPFHAWLADIELLGQNEKPSVLPRVPFGDARAGGAAFMPETVLTSVWTDAETTLTRSDRIVELSNRLQPDGTLAWEVPDGNWVVARIGATVSGETTSAVGLFPSRPNWEANKLSAVAAKAFLAGFFDRLVGDPRAKPYLGKTLIGLHLDSWECSHHLWSEAVRRTWKERMPYDLEKWLPALLGFTVDSPELTRLFLWDYHRMIADLSGDEFMRTIRDRAHEVGLHIETEFPTRDRFKTFEYTDIPITEFSPKGDDGRAGLLKEGVQEGAKMTSSAAHLYGRPVTSAEAFLAREKTIKPDHLSPVLGRRDDGIRKFDRDPYALKSSADKVFAQGVNHLIFHLFLHQPFLDKKPGLTTVYGTNFGRDLIWWPMARPWVDYLTRCQFLLQQGVPQADFLFCLSEGALPHTKVKALSGPDYGFTLDSGYDFDFCAGQNVINLCSVKDGKIVLPSGVRYEMLVLGDLGGEITYALLRKVAGLVEQGVAVLAAPVYRSLSLADQVSGHDGKLRELTGALWGDIDGKRVKEKAYGRGRVLWGYTIPEALRHIGVAPAFTSSVPSVEFAHRRAGEDDIFFLTSQSDQAVTATCRFRATGPAVEFWHPDTGRIEPARGLRTDAAGTEMTIVFPPNGSLFVVFRPRASSISAVTPVLTGETRAIIGPWQVAFSSPFGEKADLSFEQLTSWPDHDDPFVKTFSGSATYRTEFEVSRAGGGGVLDLGEVWNLARVSVNGISFDPLWKPPYRIDISSALVEGKNRLEIEVRNTWVNRLIGDLKLPEAERKTWININPHKATSPLRPAGLLGPVRLWRHHKEGPEKPLHAPVGHP